MRLPARIALLCWLPALCLAAAPGEESRHWAFRPLERPPLPRATQAGWGANPVDRFILARLEARNLHPSPPADRRALLRRLHYVLVGLPPSPEEMHFFLQDTRPDAYERRVDQLLASPHYGEKWARHWLDVIAFGETHGFEVNTPRENAWPYRDYVIRAFNQDKPYTAFIRDQIAGDLTGEDAATGFLVARAALLPGQVGKDEESMRLARQDELSDMALAVGGAFLGLTLHCARCHDHKFDPVTQQDYYAMTALLSGVRHGERPLRAGEPAQRKQRAQAVRERLQSLDAQIVRMLLPDASDPPMQPPPDARRNEETFPAVTTRRVRFTIRDANLHPSLGLIEPCIDEFEIFTADDRNVALATTGTRVTASGTIHGSKIHRLEHINDGQYGNARSWMSDEPGRGWVLFELPAPATIDRVVWSRDREGRFTDRLAIDYILEVEGPEGDWRLVASSRNRQPYQPVKRLQAMVEAGEVAAPQARSLINQRRQLEASLRQLTRTPMVYAGRFTDPDTTYLLHRGDPMQPKDPVAPGTPVALSPRRTLPPAAPEADRRRLLAEWVAHPRNPLTARVMVNRLWQHLFGEGLVSTPSDFGRNGARPVNRSLLDWLAAEFIERGWSLKAMQKLIVMSAAFQQSSQPRSDALAIDAASRLLWRYPPRRMSAEQIRDTMLSVAGTLNPRMEGPGYSVFKPNDNYVRVYDPKETFGPEEWRRMIYQTKVRMEQDATFGVFDCPDAGQPQPKRPRSTTPLQALSLFNSHFVVEQAEHWARRLRREAGPDPAAQVHRAFQLAFHRGPDAKELHACTALVNKHGLQTLTRVLFNSNEFVFLN